MKRSSPRTKSRTKTKGAPQRTKTLSFFGGFAVVAVVMFIGLVDPLATTYDRAVADSATTTVSTRVVLPASAPALDKVAYDKKLYQLANNGTVPPGTAIASTTATTTPVAHLWPVKTVYPETGALLPFNRIVAYYGNFYSTKMGVLGEYPAPEMLQRLTQAAADWRQADPSTPVIPAIDYIAVTAQGSPGADGKYRFRMPDEQIQHAIDLADQVHGVVVLDVQVGLSTLQAELPVLKPYLERPEVHLAIDPEFSMKHGEKPGTVIGTFDATDINYAAEFLADIVRENNLPPKILVVHRFTENMVTRTELIRPLPEVQIVMDMDGWGFAAKKINTYKQVIYPEPVQFTGFKLFYKNDIKPPSTRMLTPAEVLELTPRPSFIQYQ